MWGAAPIAYPFNLAKYSEATTGYRRVFETTEAQPGLQLKIPTSSVLRGKRPAYVVFTSLWYDAGRGEYHMVDATAISSLNKWQRTLGHLSQFIRWLLHQRMS